MRNPQASCGVGRLRRPLHRTGYFFLLWALVPSVGSAQVDFPRLQGPYMGQTPPGLTPEVFLPGILIDEEQGAFCTVFSSPLDEFFFVTYQKGVDGSGHLQRMVLSNGRWDAPEALSFSEEGMDNDLCLSVDGTRVIFRSWRPLPDGSAPEDHSWLWMADRVGGRWGESRPVLAGGRNVNSGYPSLAASGALYFRARWDGVQGIWRAEPSASAYGHPERVTTLFSDDFIHGDMFVAPDESYMIVSGRDPEDRFGHGNLDLYVVFREADGSWSQPVDMGESINTHAGENCPQVTPDGRYFFFNRYDPELDEGNMYWMDAGIIEALRGSGS